MADKYFTFEEAQTLLPILEGLMRTAVDSKQTIESVDVQFEELRQCIFMNGGMSVDILALARRRAEKDKAVQRAKDTLAEIDSIGVQVKDLDTGLLDFPCVVEDQVILLCWKMGEKGITHWHGVEEGFRGRKPIDERITKSKRKRPN
jgi:hypothetical protein